MKLVYGIGFNDRRYPTRLNGRDTKEYSLWAGMLERCTEKRGKTKYLGLFLTKEEAFITYKTFKEQLIKDVANDYKLLLDDRLYQALIDYNVSIND